MATLAVQWLFLHGHIANVALARELAGNDIQSANIAPVRMAPDSPASIHPDQLQAETTRVREAND